MAINLHEKYAKKIQTEYVKESVVKGRLSDQYDFTGVKTVVISTPTTVAMVDYDRTAAGNRYGTPTEMQDVIQELTLTQDKSFSLVIDKGNNMDQNGIKAAGKMLRLQIQEQAVPMFDTYVLNTLATKAGATATGAITTSALLQTAVLAGTAALDDAEVPDSNRTLYLTAAMYALLKQTAYFVPNESISKAAFSKGRVGIYDNMEVVRVPTGRWPVGYNFLIVHKAAATAPVKLNDTKIHVDPPGYSGNLLEGRQYYDCFIFNPKAKGIYANKAS